MKRIVCLLLALCTILAIGTSVCGADDEIKFRGTPFGTKYDDVLSALA